MKFWFIVWCHTALAWELGRLTGNKDADPVIFIITAVALLASYFVVLAINKI
jgi:hypothetical protein